MSVTIEIRRQEAARLSYSETPTTVSDTFTILRSPEEWYCVDLFVSSKHITRSSQSYNMKAQWAEHDNFQDFKN